MATNLDTTNPNYPQLLDRETELSHSKLKDILSFLNVNARPDLPPSFRGSDSPLDASLFPHLFAGDELAALK